MLKRVLVVLFLVCALEACMHPAFACSQVCAVVGDTVLFGNNEDHSWGYPLHGDVTGSYVWFYPPSSGRYPGHYGCMFIGWYWGDEVSFQGGMNDHGLCWDLTAVQAVRMTPHPERPYSKAASSLFVPLTRNCSTVDEAIALVFQFDFETMAYQIHLADATGDSAVISPSPDGELLITRLDPDCCYLVSTASMNLASPDTQHGPQAVERYDAASRILSTTTQGDLTADALGAVLEAMHQRGGDTSCTYTVYANIFNPKTGDVYLYFASEFHEAAVFNLPSELVNGEHRIRICELFSEATVQRAVNKSSMRRTHFVLKIGGVIGVSSLIGVVVLFSVKKRRRNAA